MKVRTKAYGEIEIEDRQRISLPHGLFGFEDLRDFVLLDATQPPFYWLQSIQRVEVAFVLIDPKFFRPDYTPDVDPAELEEIGIAGADDMLVFSIVTIPPADQRMTANLQGPLMINRRTHVARQSISTNPRWGVRHGILDEMAQARGKVPQDDPAPQNPPSAAPQNPPSAAPQNPPSAAREPRC
jgi:flagellar assembly factor FliW